MTVKNRTCIILNNLQISHFSSGNLINLPFWHTDYSVVPSLDISANVPTEGIFRCTEKKIQGCKNDHRRADGQGLTLYHFICNAL